MSERSVDILVVGDGISARAMLWELWRVDHTLDVLQIYDEKLFPMTSLKSTGLVALHGMQKGISPLGDKLVEGVENFFNNVMGTGLKGLSRGSFYDTCPSGNERLLKRYGQEKNLSDFSLPLDIVAKNIKAVEEEAAFIEPRLFLSSVLEQSDFKSMRGNLISIDDKRALLDNGKKINFNKIILCVGPSTKYLKDFDIDDNRVIKEVCGSFFVWEKDLGQESFAFGLGKSNLVYRAKEKLLMLGGTTQSNEINSHDGEELLSFYRAAREYFGNQVPDTQEARVCSGVRIKGPKRLPINDEVKKDVFVLGAAYKNGWSQAFLGAKEIRKLLF